MATTEPEAYASVVNHSQGNALTRIVSSASQLSRRQSSRVYDSDDEDDRENRQGRPQPFVNRGVAFAAAEPDQAEDEEHRPGHRLHRDVDMYRPQHIVQRGRVFGRGDRQRGAGGLACRT